MKYIFILLLIACNKPPICKDEISISIPLENQITLSHIEVYMSNDRGIFLADILLPVKTQNHTYGMVYDITNRTAPGNIYIQYKIFDGQDGSFFFSKIDTLK